LRLKQHEIIQVLRRRLGMNQGTFGAKAFDTSFESGRTKIKNIELGKQNPTEKDLRKMARVLGASVDELKSNGEAQSVGHTPSSKGVVISAATLEVFPEIGPYLEMLNKAVVLDDRELIGYLCEKLSEIFASRPEKKVAQ